MPKLYNSNPIVVGISEIVDENNIILTFIDLDVNLGYSPFFLKYNSGKNRIILELIRGIMYT
jgi:hypothetical protein